MNTNHISKPKYNDTEIPSLQPDAFIASLWQMKEAQLAELHKHLGYLLRAKNALQKTLQIPHPRFKAAISILPPTPPGLPMSPDCEGSRKPLRTPKAGSLRATILQVLREAAKPMPRAEIIDRVAQLQAKVPDQMLKNKVGNILANPHDPYFERTAYGIYRSRPDQR